MNFAQVVRTIWRYGAYPAFGVVVFIASLYVTFPYERLRDRLVNALQEGRDLDVSIGDVSPAWGGGLVLSDVSVSAVPQGPEEPGAPLKISEASVRFGLLAALFGSLDASFSAELLEGELEGDIESDEESTRLRLYTDGLSLSHFAWVPSAIGLPLVGTLRADVDMTLPKGRFDQAEGTVRLDCIGCALGDGKSKFKPPGSSGFMAEGITLPKLRIGDWGGNITVAKGTATFTGFETKSADGETALEGDIDLKDPIARSPMRMYFRFKMADALKKKDAKLELLEQGLSASGRRDDGFYGLRISGLLGSMRFLPSKYSPVTPKSAGRTRARPPSRRPSRPSRPWTPPRRQPERPEVPPPTPPPIQAAPEEPAEPEAITPPPMPEPPRTPAPTPTEGAEEDKPTEEGEGPAEEGDSPEPEEVEE